MFIVRKIISFLRPLVDRFPRVANLYRTVRNQIAFMEKPVVTPWGFKLTGNSSMAQGSFEPLETTIVRKILEDVDVLVNVGANVGYYCCHALSKGKAVIAFEPIQQNLRYLCQNIKVNNWSGVEIFPMALYDKIGILDIYGGDTGASVIKGWAGVPDNYKTLVPSSTMDVVLGSRLQGKKMLIIMDVEGAEKGVLDGAANMLAIEPKPIWLVEIVADENQAHGVEINPNFKSIFQLFFENGYQAFNVDQYMGPVTMDQVNLILDGSLNATTYNYLFCQAQDNIISKCRQRMEE